jgi:predicted  nucleic acid-binding Zn-ribbon protein
MEKGAAVAVKWDINFGTLIPIGMALFAGAIYINTQLTSLEARLNQTESFRASRTAQTDQNFVQLTAAIQAMQNNIAKQNAETSNLNYRMGQNEAGIEAASKRMDRIADTVLTAVESIKRDLGTLSTEVKLGTQKTDTLSSKIDSLDVPRTQRPRS